MRNDVTADQPHEEWLDGRPVDCAVPLEYRDGLPADCSPVRSAPTGGRRRPVRLPEAHRGDSARAAGAGCRRRAPDVMTSEAVPLDARGTLLAVIDTVMDILRDD